LIFPINHCDFPVRFLYVYHRVNPILISRKINLWLLNFRASCFCDFRTVGWYADSRTATGWVPPSVAVGWKKNMRQLPWISMKTSGLWILLVILCYIYQYSTINHGLFSHFSVRQLSKRARLGAPSCSFLIPICQNTSQHLRIFWIYNRLYSNIDSWLSNGECFAEKMICGLVVYLCLV